MRTADLLRGLLAQLAETTLRYLAEHAFRTAEDYGASVGIRDGAKLPDVPAVPKVYGIPGASSRLKRGQPILVGFRAGEAGAPIVVGYPEGCKAVEVGLDAESVIRLGGAAAFPLAQGEATDARIETLRKAIVAVATAAKAPVPPSVAAPLASVATTKVRGE
jgi:hypothetical protein